jgi:hypothetical protein
VAVFFSIIGALLLLLLPNLFQLVVRRCLTSQSTRPRQTAPARIWGTVTIKRQRRTATT